MTTVSGKLQAGELRDDGLVQDSVARAEAALAAARAVPVHYYFRILGHLGGSRRDTAPSVGAFFDSFKPGLCDECSGCRVRIQGTVAAPRFAPAMYWIAACATR
jgi:hypothetical protein